MTADDPRPLPPLHPDLDTLADLDAGVLDAATAERVTGHVRTCARCGAALRAMSAVQNDLRALPTPPMPAAVAARLEDVLADLRRGERDGVGAASGPAVPPPVAGRPGDDRPDQPRPGQSDDDRPDPGRTGGERRVSAGPAPVSDLDAARERRRRRLTRVAGSVAAAVAVLAAAGSVTALVRAAGGDNAESGTAAAGGGEQAPAGDSAGPGLTFEVPSYGRESLRAALPQIEQQSAVNAITGPGDTGPAGAMADAARRTACAGTIRGARGELRAVRRIVYEGRMAYVFLFSADGRRTAYVVSDACGTSPALPAAVLDTVS